MAALALPIGTSAGNNRFSRYSNPEYDAILDEMAPLNADDPRFTELAVQAMEIYWRDQIDIPIIQWLHRIAYNQTYWTNWPTADNIGPGVNGAFWASHGHAGRHQSTESGVRENLCLRSQLCQVLTVRCSGKCKVDFGPILRGMLSPSRISLLRSPRREASRG